MEPLACCQVKSGVGHIAFYVNSPGILQENVKIFNTGGIKTIEVVCVPEHHAMKAYKVEWV